MGNQVEFQKKLAEMVAFAKDKENKISQQEVERFFTADTLTEEQIQLVFDYLLSQKIAVVGYIKMGDQEVTPEFSQNELDYLEEYTTDLKALKSEEAGEMVALYQALLAGDQTALTRFTEIYLTHIVEIGKSMYHPQVFVGDLIQEGNVCLMMALAEGKELPVLERESIMEFLDTQIRQGIQMLIEETVELKSRDQKMVDKVAMLDESITKLTADLGRKVTIDELVLYTEMSEEEIDEILKLTGEE